MTMLLLLFGRTTKVFCLKSNIGLEDNINNNNNNDDGFNLDAIPNLKLNHSNGILDEILDNDHRDHLLSKERIYNGEVVQIGVITSFVEIIIGENGKRVSWCAGSLIDRQHVLTSASCLDAANENRSIFLIMGVVNINDNRRVVSEAISKIVHPLYNNKDYPYAYDVALLRIKTVDYSRNLQPAILAGKSTTEQSMFELPLYILGYGDINLGPNNQVLKYSSAKLRKMSECDEYNKTESTLCARANPGSPCLGDEGGPVYVFYHGTFVQVGIAMVNIFEHCEVNQNFAFTNVGPYKEWIYKTILSDICQSNV